jgi:hypothetical protein
LVHRRRKRRRAAVTLTLVLLAMTGTFTYAVASFRGLVGTVPSAVASSTCQETLPVGAVKPNEVTLNVYNATDRPNLAASTAKTLTKQGFTIARVENDPLSQYLEGAGQVRHGEAGTAAATLAATRLSGAEMVMDNRNDATVDIVLGEGFKGLGAPAKAGQPAAARSTATPPPECADVVEVAAVQ